MVPEKHDFQSLENLYADLIDRLKKSRDTKLSAAARTEAKDAMVACQARIDSFLPAEMTDQEKMSLRADFQRMMIAQRDQNARIDLDGLPEKIDKIFPGFAAYKEEQFSKVLAERRAAAPVGGNNLAQTTSVPGPVDAPVAADPRDVAEFGQFMADFIAQWVNEDIKKGRPKDLIDDAIEKFREVQRAKAIRRKNAVVQSDVEQFGQSAAESIAKWVVGEQDKGRPQEEIDAAIEMQRRKLRCQAVLQQSDVAQFGQANAMHIAEWTLSQREKGVEGALINATAEKYRKALTNGGYAKDDACNRLDYNIIETSTHCRNTAQVIGTENKDAFRRFYLDALNEYKISMKLLYINTFLLIPARDLCKMRANISKAEMQKLCTTLNDLSKEYQHKVENGLFASKKEMHKEAITKKMFDAFNDTFNDPDITEKNYTDLCELLCYAAEDRSLDDWLSSLADGTKLPSFYMDGGEIVPSYMAGSKPEYRFHYLYRYVESCLNVSQALPAACIKTSFRDKKKELRFTDLPNKYRTYENYVETFSKEAEMLSDCVEYNDCKRMFRYKEYSSCYHRMVADINEYIKSTGDTRYDADSFFAAAAEYYSGLLSTKKRPQDYKSLFDVFDHIVSTKDRYDRLLKEEMSRINGIIEDYNDRTEARIAGMGWGMGGGLIGGIIGGGLARYNYKQEFLIHKWDSEIFKQATENLKNAGVSQWPD